jgi:CBS domain-containing protein
MKCPGCDHEFIQGEDSCGHCGYDLSDLGVPGPKRGRLHELILEDPLSQLNAPVPITVKTTDAVAKVVELMKKNRHGSVLVLDLGGALAGIFTERDLLRRLGGGSAQIQTATVGEVMTAHPETLTEEDTIAHALNCMAVGGYRHIPLVREGAPVGFVSIRGILTYISQNAL